MVCDLPNCKLKTRLENEGVLSYHTADTTCTFVMSNFTNNSQFHAGAMHEGLEVMTTGRPPVNTKAEWFYKGVRLENSDRSRPLPLNGEVVDSTTFTTDYPELTDWHPPMLSTPILKSPVTHVQMNRDNCANQYQGRHGLLVTQEMFARTGLHYHDVACQPEHGKCASDGASRQVSTGVKR